MKMKTRFLALALPVIIIVILVAALLPGKMPLPGFTIITPEQAGFNAEKLTRMQTHLESYVDNGKIGGLVTLIARDAKIIHLKTHGFQNIAAEKPLQLTTIFRLASMTKPITAVALMILQEKGRVSLDDPLVKYIPQFAKTRVMGPGGELQPLRRPITVKDVLMHTSGITAGHYGNGPVHMAYRESKLGDAGNLADFVNSLADLPLLHQPGESWSYGFSTDVVARIVEVAGGMPYGQFVRKNILEPLKMKDSGFELAESKMDRLAGLYRYGSDGGLSEVPAPANSAFARGVSGMHGTIGDYLRFAQMLLNGGELEGVRILKSSTIEMMTQNHLPPELVPFSVIGNRMDNNGFGLGVSVVVDNARAETLPNGFWWNKGAPPVGSYWWVGAYQTYFWIDPENKIIGLLMAQSVNMQFPFMQEFHAMAYDALK